MDVCERLAELPALRDERKALPAVARPSVVAVQTLFFGLRDEFDRVPDGTRPDGGLGYIDADFMGRPADVCHGIG